MFYSTFLKTVGFIKMYLFIKHFMVLMNFLVPEWEVFGIWPIERGDFQIGLYIYVFFRHPLYFKLLLKYYSYGWLTFSLLEY